MTSSGLYNCASDEMQIWNVSFTKLSLFRKLVRFALICFIDFVIVYACYSSESINMPRYKPIIGLETMSLNAQQRQAKEAYNYYYKEFHNMASELGSYVNRYQDNIAANELIKEFNKFAKKPCWVHVYRGNPSEFMVGLPILKAGIALLKSKLSLVMSSYVQNDVRTHSSDTNDKSENQKENRLLGDAHDQCERTGKDGWSSNWIISDELRIWTDKKGRKIEAAWQHISEDGKTIWVLRKDNKYVKVNVGGLSNADALFVNNQLKTWAENGCIWWRGVYLTKDGYRENRYYYKSLNMIAEKSLNGFWDLEVFQAWNYGALCRYGHHRNGYFNGESSRLIFFHSGEKGTLANGEIIHKLRLYWAGTMTYQTVAGQANTVACYTSDLDFAIKLVRIRMELYDKGDPRFEDRAPATPKENDGNAMLPVIVATGSGFFVTKNGYVVTNHHVIEGASKFRILTAVGTFDAHLIKSDSNTDLAILKVDGNFTPLQFSHRRIEKLGTTVLTMGFPRPGVQGFSPKVTKGIISGEEGFKGDVREYQIDASIQPGNSGGPLLSDQGEVIGVVVSTLVGGQTVNYAIKKSYLLAFLDTIPGCANGIIEGTGDNRFSSLEEVVAAVRNSCILIEALK